MNMRSPAGRFVVGVDIGGTCTDVAMVDLLTKQRFFYKTESIPHAIEQGVADSVEALLRRESRRPEDCAAFIHGTTLALNAVLTRSGARVGVLVTAGFGDILEIGRLQMPDPFNFYTQKPQPLVRRNWVREVEERILSNGQIDTRLDSRSVQVAAEELIKAGAEIMAISFINAFRNPEHEMKAFQIIRQHYRSIPIILSSEVWPEIREYERTMVTVMNAFVATRISSYLDRLESCVNGIGLNVPVNITTSNGGTLPARLIRGRPGMTLLSGPASGIIASAHVAIECKLENVIAFDMGGTSSDFAVLTNANIPYSSETRIGDFPVIFPSVDVVSVGAGGGSIARLDSMGVLKVGPESAGAEPGPVCYGRGGQNATVTDAYVVSGILDPNNFLGGRVKLAADLSRKAIARLAAGTKYSSDQLAEGVLRVATSNLILGIGKIEGRIGIDIRDFALLAYGGAGPTHACMLAEELGIRRIIVPVSPGTFCALGSLSADFRLDFVQTVNFNLADPDWDFMVKWHFEKEQQAYKQLATEAELISAFMAVRTVDIRYEGQGFNTEIAFPADSLRDRDTKALASAFHDRYERLYGIGQPSVPAEIVNLRLTMVGRRQQALMATEMMETSDLSRPTGSRQVFFDDLRQSIPVYRRSDLAPASTFDGPCIVDQEDTTTFVRPDWSASVDQYRILHLERKEG